MHQDKIKINENIDALHYLRFYLNQVLNLQLVRLIK